MRHSLRKSLLITGVLSVLTLSDGISSRMAIGAPSQALTIKHALEAAYSNNPELAAAQWDIDIAKGGRVQAGVIPNPELSWDVEDTRNNSRITTVKVSQSLELGGKRAARIDVASKAQDAASVELERKRNILRAEVIDVFYGALRAQERVQLAGQSLALAKRGLTVATGRVKAGKSSPVEETRAKVQLSEVRLEFSRADMERTNAYQRLASVMGVFPPQFSGVQDSTGLPPQMPASSNLIRLIPETAEFRLAELQIDQQEASLGLEKTLRIPDLNVSVGSQYDASIRERVNVVGVSMPIPLFDRNQGNVLSAARRADQARDLKTATELRLRSETLQALDQWSTALNEVKSFNEVILPAAQSAVDTATRGFEMGKFNFLDVLDAQRTLIGARTQYIQAIALSVDAWVRIERTYGDVITTLR